MLFVDDEVSLREVGGAMLEMTDYNVIMACDGLEVLDDLKKTIRKLGWY